MMEKRLALVTGATGMIGTHLVKRLAREGYGVRALVRATSDTREIKESGAETVVGDITEGAETLAGKMGGVTHVFHLAALVDDWGSREEMYRVNVTGLENVLEACAGGRGIQRIVVMGSLAIYGLGKQENVNETREMVYSGDNYNYTKIEAEKLCQRFAKEKGLPIVIIRAPYVYGEGDRQLLSRLCTTLREGTFKYIDEGKTPLELAYAGNVAEAMAKAAVAEGLKPGEAFIITDGKAVTRREMVETICEVMGYKKPTGSVPRWLAKMLCPIYEAKAKLTGSRKPPRINRFRLKFMGTHLTFDISKARRMLGYKAEHEPGEALARSVRWYKEKDTNKSIINEQLATGK